MALSFLANIGDIAEEAEAFVQQLFHSYSLILDQNAKEKIKDSIQHLFHLNNSHDTAMDNLSEMADIPEAIGNWKTLSPASIMVMHSILFPTSMWFTQPDMLQFLKQWFVTQLKPLRIWSVGSGLGYEPYSISCCYSEVEHFFEKNNLPNLSIIGSEVSAEAMSIAKRGIYAKPALKGMSWFQKRKFFQKIAHDKGPYYQLKEREKARVNFITQDILKGFHQLDFFDMIFCTEILPYFTPQLRYVIACRLSDRLKPNGYLFLGNEAVDLGDLRDMKRIELDKGVLYQKQP